MPTNADLQLPADTEASELRRAAISHDWLSEADAMNRLAIDAETLRELREERRVIAAWDVPTQGWRYPPFQFQGERIAPQVVPLMECLVEMAFASGWGEVEWLYSAHALMAGRNPAAVFTQDPDRVLGAAYQEFVKERDSGW